MAILVAALRSTITAQGSATEGPLGPLVLIGLLMVPIVVGALALSAALALRRLRSSGVVVEVAVGVLAVGIAFQVFLVGWLVLTGRHAALLAWPVTGDALLYLNILGGLGLGFLVIWLGVLHGLIKQADAHSEEVEETNRKLRHRTEELEEFSYAVSHDLKSPLISLQWLIEELVDQRDPETRAFLASRIEQNVGHMSDLVEDLLLLARIEREGAVDTSEDVLPVAQQALEAIAPLYHRRNVQVDLDDVAGAQVRLPRARIRQILQNLLANAVLHGREGGRVRVSCHGTEDEDLIRLEVADDGPGVPEEEREAIFAAFVRRSPTTEGSGIGLALVRKIARAYSGRAWVEQAPEGGACFCVLLPGEFADASPAIPVNLEESLRLPPVN